MKILFDLDGTVTAAETLPIISRHFSVEKEIEKLTKETVNGNIPFIESFIRRVNMLGHLPVSRYQLFFRRSHCILRFLILYVLIVIYV